MVALTAISYAIDTPTNLHCDTPNDLDGHFYMRWDTVAGTVTYELQESLNSDFSGPYVGYWPYSEYANKEYITFKTNGTYYYRIRAWDNFPASGGVASNWSNSYSVNVTITHTLTAPILTDPGTTSTTGSYTLDWSEPSSATIYEAWEDDNPSFSNINQTEFEGTGKYWFALSPVNFNKPNSTYYYKIRAWTADPRISPTNCSNSNWSNIEDIIVNIITSPNTPSLTDPGTTDTDGNYQLQWSDQSGSGATIYELWEDDNASFTSPNYYWPTPNNQWVTNGNGTYYYRVRAWTNTPENGGVSSGWSNVVDMIVDIPAAPPNTPTLSDPGGTDTDGIYTVQWTDESSSGATIYELQDYYNTTFENPGRYWPSSNSEQITQTTNGTYYYRVRAWTDVPENGGVSSGWSNIVDIIVDTSTTVNPPVLYDPGGVNTTGNYDVSWSEVSVAEYYKLQEDDNINFTSPTEYNPTTTSQQFTGQSDGTYYYRVNASYLNNGWQTTDWSNVEDIVVNIDGGEDIESVYHNFNTVLSPDNFGGDTGAMDPDPGDDTETIAVSLTTDAYEGASAMKMDYKIEQGTWVGWWSFMLQSHEGHDISQTADKIKMWVKGAQGGEQFKVELKDTTNKVATVLVINLETYYQEKQIPLGLFTGLDFTEIKQLNIVIDSGVYESEIYIDNIIIAGTGDSSPITVIVDQDLGVDVSGAIDLGTLGLNEDVVSSNALVITNSGTINETFYISQLPAEAWIPIMSLPFVLGRDEYVLKGIFNSGSPGIISDESRYVVKIFPESCGDTAGNFAGNINGYDVAPGESRDLWVGFKSPSATSSEETQTIMLVITAASP